MAGGGGVAVGNNNNGNGNNVVGSLQCPPGTVMLEEPVDEDAIIDDDDHHDNDNYVNGGHHLMESYGGGGGGDNNGNNNGIIYGIYGGSGLTTPGAAGSSSSGGGRRISWEYLSVSVTRVPGYGFGIAVSGGSDNPHFANGDPAIAISDVLKGGPAEGKLNVNDRIMSANGQKLENVEYGVAVGVLRESGPTVNLVVKRRRVVNACARVVLNKQTSTKYKNCTGADFGLSLSVRVFLKDLKTNGSGVAVAEGDEIIAINNVDVNKVIDWKHIFSSSCSSDNNNKNNCVVLNVIRQQQHQQQQQQNGYGHHHHHGTQPSYESTTTGVGNLYVQPPTRGHNHTRYNHSRGASMDDDLLLPPPPPPPPPIRPPLPPLELMGDPADHHLQQQQQLPPPLPQVNLVQQQQQVHPAPPPSAPAPPAPRYVNFVKRRHLGLRLCGGNNVGLYVSAVQEGTGAEGAGLSRGDRILRVNDLDFSSLTREEAISQLASLQTDSLVSMVTRFEPQFEQILRDNEFHDKVYFRIKYDLNDAVKKNAVVVVSDTLASSSGSAAAGAGGGGGGGGSKGNNNNLFAWEGYAVGGGKVRLPNVKQAKEIFSNSEKEPYVRVARRKVGGGGGGGGFARPVAIWSHLNSDLHEQIIKARPHQFFKVVSTTVEEIELELRSKSGGGGGLKHQQQHQHQRGLLVGCSVELFEGLWSAGVCPGGVVVKTEDKNVLKDILRGLNKNYSANYYATLIRSFKGSPQGTFRKQREELEWVERELGAWATTVTLDHNYVNRVTDAALRATNEHVLWVDVALLLQQQQQHQRPAASSSSSSKRNQQQQHGRSSVDLSVVEGGVGGVNREVPDYNKPPPFVLGESAASASSGGGRGEEAPFKVRLAHSPEPPPPPPVVVSAPPPAAAVPAPKVDRTKKPNPAAVFLQQQQQPQVLQQQQQQPSSVRGNNKPVPPPKPKLTSTWNKQNEQQLQLQQQLRRSNDNNDSYYLNLPVTSKVVVMQQQQQQNLLPPPSSSSSRIAGSAFELYRKPQQVQQDSSAVAAIPPSPLAAAPQSSSLPLLQENTTSGSFDWRGGVLVQRNVPPGGPPPIEVRVPEGAIPKGTRQTIWFHAVLPANNNNNGNHLLPGMIIEGAVGGSSSSSSCLISPLVKFGPEGLRFARPIEIRIPQYSRQSTNAAVLLGGSNSNNNNKQWSKININNDNHGDDEEDIPYKIVSLTIQQF